MATKLDEHWEFIASECKKRIKKNQSAGIRSVIKSHNHLKDIEPTEEDLATIELSLTKDYQYMSYMRGGDIFITRNPLRHQRQNSYNTPVFFCSYFIYSLKLYQHLQ